MTFHSSVGKSAKKKQKKVKKDPIFYMKKHLNFNSNKFFFFHIYTQYIQYILK